MGSGEDKIGTGVISLSMELDTTATKKMEANLERSISKASRTMRINKAESRRTGVPTSIGRKKNMMMMGPSIGKAMGLGGNVHETGVESTSAEDIKSLSFSVGHLCKHLDKLTAYSKLKKKTSIRLGKAEDVVWDVNDKKKKGLLDKEEMILDKEVKKQKSFWDKVAPHLWMRMNSGKVSGGVSANLMAMFTGGRGGGQTAGKGTKGGGGGEAAAGGALAAGLSVTLLAILGVLMGIWMFVKETEVIKGTINVLTGMVGAFLSPIVMSVALIADGVSGLKGAIREDFETWAAPYKDIANAMVEETEKNRKWIDAFSDFATWYVDNLKVKLGTMWEGLKTTFYNTFTLPAMEDLTNMWFNLKRDYITPVMEAVETTWGAMNGNIMDMELVFNRVGLVVGGIDKAASHFNMNMGDIINGIISVATSLKNVFVDKFLNPVGEMIVSVINYMIDKVNIILPKKYEVGNLKWKPYSTDGEAA